MLLEEYLCAQYNWRLYTEFLHQLMVLPTCYTSDQVFRLGRVMFDRLECVSIYTLNIYIFFLICTVYNFNINYFILFTI